ncbi:regulatory protein RecX [Thiothrix nivea]|uniref:Regulatory protein RecX n=1 Tax=Thiothrix nivea (strain ATCC 35100 / DSM 5205 / JP2) TaxID=870187 RepID=A0A656HGV3_THINJ|nr:regulatory protein RecX [Thiothrix nivea]EIJ36138.1 Regulatory protein recX [Thiothrix nivea DSM 5205]
MYEGAHDCEAAAVRLLAQREHSRRELAQKLRQRCECDTDSLNRLLERLQELGYLDDTRYAGMFVRSSVTRGRGPQRIAYELRDRGVDDIIAAQALAEADVDWQALAAEQREKKFGRVIPADYKERARQSRFLAGRGFYMDTIKAVFQRRPD